MAMKQTPVLNASKPATGIGSISRIESELTLGVHQNHKSE
jgi:hypothetical protein